MNKPCAVITGASSGIGKDLAVRMLDLGYDIINVSRRDADYTHENLYNVGCDLTDAKATSAAAAAIVEKHNVTHFIHNAGMILPNLLEEASAEDILTLSQLHAGAALIFVQAFAPAMKEAGFGRIVFNSSRAAMGVPTRTAYSFTKAGIHGMARTWALELGPYGITVNVVAPGPILTDNFWGIVDKGSDREQKIAESLPVRLLGTPEDVSNALLFFCGQENGFVTGQTLYVCGGASIGGMAI
ncbi:MAG: SDR family oxidoreductase [Kordiimonadaceae bacterium]|nr:SDR family oxidoreductase [Kordiimonadaceae bacterium]